MIDIQGIEKQMAERLDDLLVESNQLPARRVRMLFPPRGMIGMVVTVKDAPRVNFKLEIYLNETEEPHFIVRYQGASCRFKITDCTPMKAEAKKGVDQKIQKIMKEIKSVWSENKETIVKAWCDTRPSNQNHGHQKIR